MVTSGGTSLFTIVIVSVHTYLLYAKSQQGKVPLKMNLIAITILYVHLNSTSWTTIKNCTALMQLAA